MEKRPSREALLKRIAELEALVEARQKGNDDALTAGMLSLADIEHAADGICVWHAIETFPFIRFSFWNQRMVVLTGYRLEEINRHGWYQSVYPDPELRARAQARMAAMRENVDRQAEEWEITRADGEKRRLRISTSVLKHGGDIPHVLAIMHDVTAQHRAEALFRKAQQDLQQELARKSASLADANRALKYSDNRYRALFERASDALFIENDRDQILDVNPKACELLGYERDELLAMTVPDIQAPECRGEKGQVLRTELSTHRGKPFEAVDLHKDGSRIPVEVTNNRIDDQGLVLSIVRDIRERKAVEQARREAYDIIAKSPVAAFLWRNAEDWPVEYVTPNVDRIFGHTAEDFLESRVVYRTVVHRDDLDRVAREVATYSREADRLAFTHEPYRIVTRGGTVRWVSDHTFIRRDLKGTVTHYQGIVMDITDRIQAEQAVRESEAKFSLAFQLSPDPFMITRMQDGQIVDVNDSFLLASGYAREEVIGRSSVEDINLWDDPLERERYIEALFKDGTARRMECRFRKKNGAVRLGSICGQVVEIAGERCILGTMRDITEERQAADRLAAEKERLTVTLRSIGDAVITTDRDGRIALINPVAEELTGWGEDEAVGKSLMEVFRIVDERSRRPCANPAEQVLASGQIVGLAKHTLLIARDGREYSIADSGAPIFDREDHIVGVVLVFRDITERQRIDKEMLKMEKLQSLGVLAGGIAHDFNNFLTGIIGNLSLAKLDTQTTDPVARTLDEMEKAAVRAKDLTQQLLTFSKGGDPVRHATRIADLVREASQFALRGSNVRCDLQIAEDLWPSEVDEGQIVQVLHNLMINADQAMPDGGVVKITGVNVSLPSDNPYALAPGDFLQLTIRDQGLGIKPEHLKKVFDPYFTTKQKGSGLGLAVAYSIVAKHDGQLTVDSKLGEGTAFTILLPAADNAAVTAHPERNHPVAGNGRILVMDDEDFIRNLVARMLPRMGYTVALAADGRTAVAMYREALEAGQAFDAVILDLTVPGGMGGKDTVRALQAIDPDVRALVSSGYSNDPVMASYLDYGFCGAVQKPYLIQELGNLLNKILRG